MLRFFLTIFWLLALALGAKGAETSADRLRALVPSEFLPLKSGEEKLIRRIYADTTIDLGTVAEGEPGKETPSGRVVRGALLSWLYTSRDVRNRVRTPAFILKGGKIQGTLDVEFSRVNFPMWFKFCEFDSIIKMSGATVPELSLGGCTIEGLKADTTTFLGHVLLDEDLDAVGSVVLSGATIGGRFDCSGGQFHTGFGAAIIAEGLRVKLDVLMGNRFRAQGLVDLSGASIGGQWICSGGQFSSAKGGIAIDGEMVTAGEIVFSTVAAEGESNETGFVAKGEVILVGATVSGQVDCSGGTFENSGGTALNARIIEASDILLRDGFSASGEVNLRRATVHGQLDCSGSTFSNEGGAALDARLVQAEDILLRDEGFVAKGEVNLKRATIEGVLDCSGGAFHRRGGIAIDGRGLSSEDIRLRDQFRAEGEVNFNRAVIDGQLDCSDGRFSNAEGVALNLQETTVRLNVRLPEGFRSNGKVDLSGSEIKGDLECEGGNFEGATDESIALDLRSIDVRNLFLRKDIRIRGEVNLKRGNVSGDFYWSGLVEPQSTQLRLTGAKVTTLYDEERSWPEKGRLWLDHFDYEQLGSSAPREAYKRLDWLKRNPRGANGEFLHSPYEKLATVLQGYGMDDDARQVMVGKELVRGEDLWSSSKFVYLWHWILGLTIGYGHYPWRAMWYIGGFVLFGAGVFGAANRRGHFVCRKSEFDSKEANVAFRFYPIVYSIDTFVPLVNLSEGDRWVPTSFRVRVYFWFHVAAGWLLSTLLAFAVAGLVKD